jgi:hypothetical protein
MNSRISATKTKEEITSTLTNLYLIMFAVSAFTSLALLFYIPTDLYSIWSFQVSDPPWLPPGYSSTNIIGSHTFGDFQLPYTLALNSDPYGWTFYNVTMPLGFLLFSIASIFPIKAMTIIFLIFSLVLFGTTLKNYFNKSGNSNLNTSIYLFCSLPILICLDRGGLQMVALALMFKGLHWYIKNPSLGSTGDKIINNLYLAAAVSMKIYLIIPILLIMVVEKKMRLFLGNFIVVLLSTNLILSFLYGGPIKVIQGLAQAYLFQTGSSDPGWIFGGVSLSKLFASVYFYNHSFAESMRFAEIYQEYVFLPGLVYLLAIYGLVMRKKFEKNYKITLILSTVFLVTPVSGAYTLVVTSFMVAILFKDLQKYESFNVQTKIRYLILVLTIFASMLPIPSKYYLTIVPSFWVLNLLLLAVLNFFDRLKLQRRKTV